MLAGIGNFFDNSNHRIVSSFMAIFALHFAVLYSYQMSAIHQIEKEKLITNVELLQIEKASPIPVAPAQPKNIWESIKQAMPIGKSGGPGPAPSRLDSMKQLLEQSTVQPAKPLETPLSKADESKLDELKKVRDQKLNELMGMTGGQKAAKLMEQEQVLRDTSKPMIKPSMGFVDKGMDEVGMKRGSLADIAKAETTKAMSGLAPTSKLVEKKEDIKRQLAAMSAMSAPGKLEDRAALRSSSNLNEVVGSMQERKKVQEVLALQKLIQEKEPTRPVPAGGGGGGGFGFGGGAGGLQGGGRGISFNEPKEPIAARARAPDSPAMMKMARAATQTGTVKEFKKAAPVEISGPLEKRKVISAYVPPYPDWAKRKGVEADVSLRFFVNPAGNVTNDISVMVTSGYKDMDQLCIESLKRWVFVPLSSTDQQVDQWGIITIRFRLQ